MKMKVPKLESEQIISAQTGGLLLIEIYKNVNNKFDISFYERREQTFQRRIWGTDFVYDTQKQAEEDSIKILEECKKTVGG